MQKNLIQEVLAAMRMHRNLMLKASKNGQQSKQELDDIIDGMAISIAKLESLLK